MRVSTLVQLGILVGGVAGAGAPAEGAYQKVYDFPGFSYANPDGVDRPVGTLVQVGSAMYGMAMGGNGGIFRYDPATNVATTVKSFNWMPDGWLPHGSLTTSGNTLYGMTTFGGTVDGGSLFSYNVQSTAFTVLHHFSPASDGASPYGSVLLSGSSLYGVTSTGGAGGRGTVFRYDLTTGAYSVLHDFAGGTADGATPYGSLVASGNALYGMTSAGGATGNGTVFRLDAGTGSLTLLHSFSGGADDGAEPHGSLLLSGSTLYGMTRTGGGAHSWGTIFSLNADTGQESVLYRFEAPKNGQYPVDSLVMVGNSLYGMTEYGGTHAFPAYSGAVFQYDLTTGTQTLLHAFGLTGDGNIPLGSLLLVGDQLYGMTEYGGLNDHGTIFTLSLPEPTILATAATLLPLLLHRRRTFPKFPLTLNQPHP